MTSLTIGKVANAAKVNIETVRYYERRGLIEQPKSPSGGFRDYPDGVIARIQFIRRAQQLGFTLTEISELLRITGSSGSSRKAVKVIAERKVKVIRERISDLRRIERTLTALVNDCSGEGPIRGCPVVDAFNQQNH